MKEPIATQRPLRGRFPTGSFGSQDTRSDRVLRISFLLPAAGIALLPVLSHGDARVVTSGTGVPHARYQAP